MSTVSSLVPKIMAGPAARDRRGATTHVRAVAARRGDGPLKALDKLERRWCCCCVTERS